MVDTIMNGIDPMLNAFIGQQINEILESNNISDAQEELFETIARVQQQYYINPIFELIGMQPIDEMASTAKTFIELTSFKRKIVNTLETVGGPVDVLAISKGKVLSGLKENTTLILKIILIIKLERVIYNVCSKFFKRKIWISR